MAEKNKEKSKKNIIFFLKENKKKIKSILSIISILVLLIILYFSFLNIRFIIKEDLVIEMPERHISMDITGEKPAELEIYSTLQTSALCKATCTQKLVSVNSNEVLFSEDFEFKRFYKVSFERTIYPYVLGEGQDIYSYSISCTSVSTANCPAKENNIQKNTIITLTRNLTESEKLLKKSQESLFNYSYFVYNNGLFLLYSSDYILSQFNYTKKDDLEKNLRLAEEKKEEFGNLLNKLEDSWLTYNHSFTEQMLQETNFILSTENFRMSSSQIYNDTVKRAEEHNDAVYKTYRLAEEIRNSQNTLFQSKQFLKEDYETLSAELKEAESLLSFSSRKIYSKEFQTYKEIFDSLNAGNISVTVFRQDYLEYMKNNSVFSKALLDVLFFEEDNCLISNTNASNTSCSKNFSDLLIDYSNITYDEWSFNVSFFCNTYNIQMETKENLSRERYAQRTNLSNESLAEINSESAKYRIYKLEKHKDELASRNDFSAKTAVNQIDKYIQNLEEEYGLSSENISKEALNISSLSLFLPLNFTFENISACEFFNGSSIINLSYEKYELPNFTFSSAKYNNTLPKLLPRACYDGKCKPYLNNSSSNYPLIIVHGHGFYSQNFRITPSDVHNDFQNRLFLEKLYVPAGTLKENDIFVENSLGFVDVPFVYKASYYPDNVLDNESINLFADRLNRIILNVKKETGKDKVIIIAHSMGGVVTRTYLKKYGTEDVDKLLIVGTPNYGITSDTVALCKLFGRDLECDEMLENSKFMSELKNETNYTIPIYTFIGEGCPTFGDDGDGVVQSAKVPLPYAINFTFNGTCSRTGDFHVNLLNPKKNPDIYNKIKDILTEEIN